MPDERVLTILQVNDSHGYLEPHWEWFWRGSTGEHRVAGGYGRIASILAAARRERPGAVLAFDCGDTIHGTHAAVASEGQALVPILNALAFDAMTAHWEFAYGPARFREIVGQLHYPMLAINCYDKASDELAFSPYTICETAGLRVGVIGIAATIVDKTMPASFSEGLRFTLGNEELPGYIARLRHEERVDLILVISHLGFPQEVQLAEEVSGIDVLLSGHTHHRLYRPAVVNGAIIIQSGCHGSFVGRLDLQVSGGRVTDYTHRLITVDEGVPADPEVEALAREATAAWRGELAGVVGETLTPLNRYTVLEATMDNLLLQALLHATSAQLAFANGWRYGAPIPPGPITLNDLWNIIPVNPPVSICRLTGDELRAMLEENLEHTFSRNPYNQMGGYVKRCLGLNAYIKVENPPGQRIQELFVANEAVRADRTYEATFVTAQGVPGKYGSDRQQLDVRAVDALQRYLARSSPVDARIRGTVVAV